MAARRPASGENPVPPIAPGAAETAVATGAAHPEPPLCRAVRSGGSIALAHLLIQAHTGDTAVAETGLRALADALPAAPREQTRQVLQLAGIPPTARLRDLTQVQRVALVASLYRQSQSPGFTHPPGT